MADKRSFNREKFLLYMLAGIFIWQAALFTYGVVGCFRMANNGKNACGRIGDRYENTVGIMVATTLALLGTNAVVNSKKTTTSQPPPQPLKRKDNEPGVSE